MEETTETPAPTKRGRKPAKKKPGKRTKVGTKAHTLKLLKSLAHARNVRKQGVQAGYPQTLRILQEYKEIILGKRGVLARETIDERVVARQILRALGLDLDKSTNGASADE